MNKKKQRERWILDNFIENYNEGRITLLRELESPDFIISLDQKKIGIELTEIFQDSHLGTSRLKQNSSDGSSFTEDFIALIQPDIPFKFLIGINFNNSHAIKKSKKNEILNKLKPICLPKIITLNDQECLELENYWDDLPKEIDFIRVYRFNGLDESIDSRPEGGLVSKLTIKHLKNILLSKERKLPEYIVCDEQWLLIIEGNYYSGSFGEIDIEFPIKSKFDIVLLFRTRTKEIIKLN